MQVKISARDTSFILDAVELSPSVVAAFENAEPEGPLLVLEIVPEAAAELLVGVLNSSLQAEAREDRRRAGRIAAGIRDQLEDQGLEVSIASAPADVVRDVGNHTPRPDLGGLTPAQLDILLMHDWDHRSPGVQVHPAGDCELLEGSRMLHNAQVLLSALSLLQPRGMEATAAGNFTRRWVGELLDAMRWREGYREFLRSDLAQINEGQAHGLLRLHAIVELAGLMERRGNRFVITELGEDLLDFEHPEELQARLVRTTFRQLNLGFTDPLAEHPDFQATLAYPVALLARTGGVWMSWRDARGALVLPTVEAMFPDDEQSDDLEHLLALRLIDPLEELGLVETQREGGFGRNIFAHGIRRIRITDLFGATIRIALDRATPYLPDLGMLDGEDGPVH